VKRGSRTDIGLGRSGISEGPSRQSSFLVFEEVDGDVNGEVGGCSSES